MREQILSDYLSGIARIRVARAGIGELSYHAALIGALNEACTQLKPLVFCVPNLRSRPGFPDRGCSSRPGQPLDERPDASPEATLTE